MIHLFLSLRLIDQILVVGYILFALFIIGSVWYVQHEIWNANLPQSIENLIGNLHALTEKIESEAYDAEWMDAKNYMKSQGENF